MFNPGFTEHLRPNLAEIDCTGFSTREHIITTPPRARIAVVPQGAARIRTQVSAALRRDDLVFAVKKFAEIKREFGL
jgi:hypothetical protein